MSPQYELRCGDVVVTDTDLGWWPEPCEVYNENNIRLTRKGAALIVVSRTRRFQPCGQQSTVFPIVEFLMISDTGELVRGSFNDNDVPTFHRVSASESQQWYT